MENNHLAIVMILTVGLGLASCLAYFSRLLKLPSVLGYLLAGFIIGPYSPGFVADHSISEQLAELGIVLMLFGVGLHFKLQDLINVRSIAIPGATIQTLMATAVTACIVYYLGEKIETGVILGLSIGVASTVVLVRVLTDNHLLNTKEGHIAVGWLVVEDIFTVIILILLPTISTFSAGNDLSLGPILWVIALVIVKIIVLSFFMFTWGHKIVNYVLIKIARFRSQEMFSLTLLALMFIIAVGSTYLFGTSIALGAFIAGMVIGKTSVRHQAAANSLPLKDIFAVVFFLSVGMLFNPMAIGENLPLFLGIVFVILIIKPLSAFLITMILGYSLKIALTVAIALAQIGEFSFILAEEALHLKLIPDEGFDILVAAALLTISLNPLLFQTLEFFESLFTKIKWLKPSPAAVRKIIEERHPFPSNNVIIVGFGPIGRNVAEVVKKKGYSPVIIEHNIDTVSDVENVSEILFGDATETTILHEAGLEHAKYLFITIPDTDTSCGIIEAARQLSNKIKILARVRYIGEIKKVEELDVSFICTEKEALTKFGSLVSELLD